MKRMRLSLAIALALALVAGSGALVWAGDSDASMACADITGGEEEYVRAVQNEDLVGNATWVTPGRLNFTMTLAAPSCVDVTYGLVVLDEDPADSESSSPQVLASASAPGDATSSQISFELQVNSDPTQSDVCLYVYTVGGAGTSSTGKTGAAFDGTSGAAMLDRAPDGPTAVEGDPSGAPGYCFYTSVGGRSYN